MPLHVGETFFGEGLVSIFLLPASLFVATTYPSSEHNLFGHSIWCLEKNLVCFLQTGPARESQRIHVSNLSVSKQVDDAHPFHASSSMSSLDFQHLSILFMSRIFELAKVNVEFSLSLLSHSEAK